MTLTPFLCKIEENIQQPKLQFKYNDAKRDFYHPKNNKKGLLKGKDKNVKIPTKNLYFLEKI